MIDSVFQLLFRYEDAISEKHIAMHQGLSHLNEIEELKRILESDNRFIPCKNSHWRCVPLHQLVEDRKIEDIDFIITDIETTGSIRGKDRIIDIAAQKVRNHEVVETFESLVNPEKTISNQIVQLTNITNEDVKDSPLIEEVLPKFVAFAGEGIFVAHNSYFDFSFINSELRRLSMPLLQTKMEICTFRIAKKLLPNVRSRGVSGLAEYFNYSLIDRHRAMPDVIATKFYLDQFLDELKKQNIETLHQLINYQKEVITKKNLRRKIKRFLRRKTQYSKQNKSRA